MMRKIKRILNVLRICLKCLLLINWYKTFILNARLLPFSQAVKLPILVRGRLKIDSLKGTLEFNCPISTGMFMIGGDQDNMPISSNPTRILINGRIIINGKLLLSHSANLVVWEGAIMELGKRVRIATGCLIKSTEYVKIGDDTIFTSGCFLMDSNIHCIKDTVTGVIKRVSHPIIIGKACWIGMNSSIMAGTVLPDYSISARYSLLNKNYSLNCGEGTMFAGMPAKPLKENMQRIFNLDRELNLIKYFKENPDADFLQVEPGFEPIEEDKIKEWFSMSYFLM